MLAISQSRSLAEMHAGLVLAGVSAGFYLPSGIATLTELTSQKHWGKAMAIHELAPNLGFITAPLLSEGLIKFFSWRGVLAVIGAGSIFMAVLFLLFGRGGKFKGETPNAPLMGKILLDPAFWMLVALFSFSIGTSLGIYAMMPLFLVSEVGLGREWANALIGLSRSFGVVVLFFSGFIVDSFGPRQSIILFLTLTGVLTILLGFLPGPTSTPVMVFLQAAASACLFPVGFAMISLLFSSQVRNLAVSLIFFISFLFGGGVVPSGLGHWAEAFSFSSGISLVGFLCLAVLALFLYRREL
jgi:NNP family nitrate/nitrite transporter-like MFS transporter